MEQLIKKNKFDKWLINFEKKQQKSGVTEVFLGYAFNIDHLKELGNQMNYQLSKMQCDEEAIRYILNNYIDCTINLKIQPA